MNYYGIKTPNKPDTPGYTWWIADSELQAWRNFFSYPSPDHNNNPHTPPLADAILAYEAIGFRCVRLNVTEIQEEVDDSVV
ncbi:MAG: hypothetical protein KAJ03_10915 [Gammaproteobacteria bacterium]|nr:hypothetical protein [Gammaproteobacteria bacterium]